MVNTETLLQRLSHVSIGVAPAEQHGQDREASGPKATFGPAGNAVVHCSPGSCSCRCCSSLFVLQELQELLHQIPELHQDLVWECRGHRRARGCQRWSLAVLRGQADVFLWCWFQTLLRGRGDDWLWCWTGSFCWAQARLEQDPVVEVLSGGVDPGVPGSLAASAPAAQSHEPEVVGFVVLADQGTPAVPLRQERGLRGCGGLLPAPGLAPLSQPLSGPHSRHGKALLQGPEPAGPRPGAAWRLSHLCTLVPDVQRTNVPGSHPRFGSAGGTGWTLWAGPGLGDKGT